MKKVSACLKPFLLSKIAIYFLIFLLFLTTGSLVVSAHGEYYFPPATDGQINEALQKTTPLRFLPSHPLYLAISVKEFLTRLSQPSSAKRAGFDFVLSGKRLKESYMLTGEGDLKNASKALVRYAKRLQRMANQLAKARSQNQDVAPLVAEIAEGLKHHEILLYAISQKWEVLENNENFDGNLQTATAAFVDTVKTINNLMPGVKDRFKTVTKLESENQESAPSPSPEEETSFEALPTTKPRRIIY